MKRLILPLVLIVLASCSPAPEIQYCSGLGLREGDAEFPNCSQYFFQEQAAFDAERGICEAQADLTYPKSLYSRPTSFPMRVYSPYGGGFAHTEMVHVGADYNQIAQVDLLRMQIIGPCMQSRGWNSPDTWQAGRHAARAGRPAPSAPLPWVK